MKFSVHISRCYSRNDNVGNIIVNEDIYIVKCNNSKEASQFLSPFLDIISDKFGNIDGHEACNIKNFIRKIISIDDWENDLDSVKFGVPLEISFCNYEIEREYLSELESGSCVDVLGFD